MSHRFREIDYRPTPIGALSLRQRHDPRLDTDIIEIKLGDEFLMTSQFTASEVALARIGLDAVAGSDLDVVVGGLGLGYTARAVLDNAAVQSVIVVEMLDPVIEWHTEGLLPLGPELVSDPRCRFVKGDFFAMAASTPGFDPEAPMRHFDAVLLDIDHSPTARLDDRSADFYQPDGLRLFASHLKPGGVFGLWSNSPPDKGFTKQLAAVFPHAWAQPVTFFNPLQDREVTQTVYMAQKAEQK